MPETPQTDPASTGAHAPMANELLASPLRDNAERCPFCDADFQGEPIPEQDQEMFGSTHFSRKVGITSWPGADRIERWRCPDCEKEWQR